MRSIRRRLQSLIIELLVVCTGNTCRSPMAAAVLGRDLAATGAVVRSAGTLGWSGRPATRPAVAVMAEIGLDLSGHRSTRLTVEVVAAADLVLVMTRDHAGAVVARDRSARRRTFLVGELGRLVRDVGPAHPDEDLRSWAERLASGRQAKLPFGRAQDEVADPAGQSVDVYRATRDRLTEALGPLVTALTQP